LYYWIQSYVEEDRMLEEEMYRRNDLVSDKICSKRTCSTKVFRRLTYSNLFNSFTLPNSRLKAPYLLGFQKSLSLIFIRKKIKKKRKKKAFLAVCDKAKKHIKSIVYARYLSGSLNTGIRKIIFVPMELPSSANKSIICKRS